MCACRWLVIALVLDRLGTPGVEIGRETPILSAAVAQSRPLVVRVMVVAGQLMFCFVPWRMSYGLALIHIV